MGLRQRCVLEWRRLVAELMRRKSRSSMLLLGRGKTKWILVREMMVQSMGIKAVNVASCAGLSCMQAALGGRQG